MFGLIVAQSLRNRLLVLALAFALVLTGALSLARLPVDVLPDLNRPTVTILTEAEGFAPTEVEQRVTYPIETRMIRPFDLAGTLQTTLNGAEARRLLRGAQSMWIGAPLHRSRDAQG